MRAITASGLVAAFLCSVITTVNAQSPYPYFPYYPYGTVTATAPPAWYYNPYTSGLGPCPQRRAVDPPCRETMEPSYSQPSFWPR